MRLLTAILLLLASAPASACELYRFRPVPTITGAQEAWIIDNTKASGAWQFYKTERSPSRLTAVKSFDGAPAGVQNYFSCD